MMPSRPVRGSALALTLGGVALLVLTGCLSPGPKAIAVWAASGDENLTHNSPPTSESETFSTSRGELRLDAALNETIAFQIALRSTAPPAGPFAIELSDLVGPADTLAADRVFSVFRVHYVRRDDFRSWYAAHVGRAATADLFPDILVPWEAPRGGGPVVLSEKRTELLWVDIHVPPTVEPGLYRGRLELQDVSSRQPVFGCNVRLNVYPVALPSRRSLPVVCRVDPRDLLAAHLRWPAGTAERLRLLPDVPSHFAALRIVNQTMRTLHDHRTTPILWASFPKFRPVGPRKVEVDWEPYDRLVSGWLDGSAFADQVRLERWPVPVSLTYPDMLQNGGLTSPRYARLLAAVLAECRRHFEQRGWLDRAMLRMCPPEPLTRDSVEKTRRLAAIVRQSETGFPLFAHLPPASLRGLGWQAAPSIDLTDVRAWAPPAMWFEPPALAREQQLGQESWLMPDQPPYSGSLAVEAPITDAWILPWIAYRYGMDGLWVERATQRAAGTEKKSSDDTLGLLYAGEPYGLRETGPVPSIRLKRLRRGLQDYELLKLLEANGEHLLARRVAEQVVRWAGTDACLQNLLSAREAGWPTDPAPLRLARTLLLRELSGRFEPTDAARQQQLAAFSDWVLIFSRAERVAVTVDGVRLVGQMESLQAVVAGSVSNATTQTVEGQWTIPQQPLGWEAVDTVSTRVPAGARRAARVKLAVPSLAYNPDGVYPFDVAFQTSTMGSFTQTARLAVAACPRLETVPRIDGRLDDWPLAANNAAGDFRLCRGQRDGGDKPTLGTQAFLRMGDAHVYVGVRCELRPDEPPQWSADNVVPTDGAIPWGQDVVEILIDPRPTAEGTSSDLYCLQVKPSGLLVSRKGPRTQPQMGTSEPWHAGARVAVSVEPEAWFVEIALPLESLGSAAQQKPLWGFNVTRLDARRGEYSSWSGARNTCYTPQSLGNLILLWP